MPEGQQPELPVISNDDPFKLHTQSLYGTIGGRMMGAVNPAVAKKASDLYGQIVRPSSLLRSNLLMHLPNRAGEAARRLQMGRDAGMRTVLTAVGTPLWNSSDPDGEPIWWATLPPFARAVPIDMQAWADDLADVLEEMRDNHGIVPDYLEIWNEPDRHEWWNGTAEEILDLIEITSNTIRNRMPNDPILLGGPGLAGGMSDMGVGKSLLVQIVENAALTGHPLDFLSWHHYHLSTGLRFYNTAGQVRDALSENNIYGVELLVTEWNIFASPVGNPEAIEFDTSHAAANLAGFLATAAQVALDGNCFFMLHDVQDQSGIADLAGKASGALTFRGVKKPVYRVMEFMYQMADEPRVKVDFPEGELALSVLATRSGNRIRMVISNDVVESEWAWNEGCKARGTKPGKLAAALDLCLQNGWQVTVENLELCGLTTEEAEVVLEVIPLSQEAERLEQTNRTAQIQITDWVTVTPVQVWRFDSQHNAPASRREEIVPMLEWVEDQALHLAYDAMAAYLITEEVDPPPFDEVIPDTVEAFAKMLETSEEIAERAWLIYFDTLGNERLAHVDLLNSLPATSVQGELPEAAGVRMVGDTLLVTLEPDSVTILDIQL